MRLLFVFILAAMIIAGCNNDDTAEVQTTAAGVEYIIHKSGEGDSINVGDFITFHLQQIANDSVFFSSYEKEPIVFKVREAEGYADPSAWVTYLRGGDSASFFMMSDSIFTQNITPPPFIQSGDTVRFVFNILEVQSEEDFMAAQEAKQEGLKQEQIQAIKNTLQQQGITDYQQSDDGIIYTVERKGPGPNPSPGQTVNLHYTISTLDGNKLMSTKDQNTPIQYTIGSGQFAGLDKGLPLLNYGTIATLYLPSTMAFGDQPNTGVPPNSPIAMEVEVLSLVDKEAELKKELTQIENYLKKNNIQAQKTPQGVYYKVDQQGTGAKPQPGQTVQVHYVGKLMNGKVFDTSREEVAKEAGTFNPQRQYGPFEFTLGQGQVIQGWEIGIPQFNTGGSGTLYIPPSLGYGNRGSGSIPPNSALIFDIELVGVK